MNRLSDQISAISKRSGFSEAEIAECLAEQLDRLLGESDMAWKGRSASDVVEDSKRERKKVMAAIHVCSANVKELTNIAGERLHLMQSAALTVGRRLGITKTMVETLGETELMERGGHIQSNGIAVIPKIATEPSDQSPQSQHES